MPVILVNNIDKDLALLVTSNLITKEEQAQIQEAVKPYKDMVQSVHIKGRKNGKLNYELGLGIPLPVGQPQAANKGSPVWTP